ncbi:MAG TPA: ABC transporter substrate-binding protein [Candidatus Methanoperedenaceae archaeon]|nr:ABC transporter substrate-binding protein [Candidatus Methanoperedenaceae archaeon]
MGDILKITVLVIAVLVFASGCTETTEQGPKPTATPSREPINLVKMSGQDMIQRLGTGEIAGFIGWEPYPSEAIVKGYGKPLIYSGDIWSHHPCCVVAYDYDWYKNSSNPDDVLDRLTLVQVKAVDYLNSAKSRDSPDHAALVAYAMEFTGSQNQTAIELAMQGVDYDYRNDIPGTTQFTDKIKGFGIFDKDKWPQSGFENASDYANSLITNKYLDWALEHRNDSLADLKLAKPVSMRYGYLVSDLHELPFWIAYRKGWYDEAGINMTLGEGTPFTNGAFEMTQGFKENKIDAGSLGIPPVIIHRINSNDFSKDDARVGVIAGMNYNGSVIVVRNDISSMKDLAGKTVGYPGPGTIQHVLFLMAAEKEGLTVVTVQ